MKCYDRLLIVALKSEWAFLKNHFPFQKISYSIPLYQIENSSQTALLQIGVGNQASRKTLLEFEKNYQCKSVFHFGLSGALVSHIKPTDLFVANHILNDNNTQIELKQDALISVLKNLNLNFLNGKLLTTASPLNTDLSKQNARQKSKCEIVDMESFAVADFFSKKEIPYFLLRGILDGLEDDLFENPKQIFQIPKFAKRHKVLQNKFKDVIFEYMKTGFQD